MDRTTKGSVVTATLVLALAGAGCGSGGDAGGVSTSSSPTSTATSSGAASAGPLATPSGNGRVPAPSGPADNLSAAHPGRVLVVTADRSGTTTTCRAHPVQGVVCAPDGSAYRFRPATVRSVELDSATVGSVGDGTPVVDLQLGGSGVGTLAALTRRAAATHRSVLLMLPGSRRVLLAATVMAPITAGDIEISGSYTVPQATEIVRLLTATAG